MKKLNASEIVALAKLNGIKVNSYKDFHLYECLNLFEFVLDYRVMGQQANDITNKLVLMRVKDSGIPDIDCKIQVLIDLTNYHNSQRPRFDVIKVTKEGYLDTYIKQECGLEEAVNAII